MKSKNSNTNSSIRCHSGGAEGADFYFEEYSEKYGIQTLAYSYKTKYHQSKNKVELTESEYQEGISHVNIANKTLNKFHIKRYMKLLARCWFQIKNAEQIFAVSSITTINNKDLVNGGTGWAVQMAIDNHKSVFLFEQNENSWFYWDYQESKFKRVNDIPKITTTDFAGIGARKINENGIQAIKDLFQKSFVFEEDSNNFNTKKMSKKQYIKRHLLIVNKLRSNPCSFKELQDYLEKHSIDDDENYVISKRTFERDVHEIREIYKVDIEYNRPQNKYHIIQEADEIKTDRLLESFQLFNALSLSESVSNHIILEKRRLLGTEHMFGLLHAIKNTLEINFIHEKYWIKTRDPKQKTVQPLALKEARNRWYLIGLDTQDNNIKPFGLDRISDLNITKKKFKFTGNYNPEITYKNSFGIITGEKEPQKIVLSFSHEQSKYVKSLPLHHSQNVLIDNETEYRIELFLCPTYDFVMELMSIGKEVKVLEPENLKQEVITKLKATLKQYE